jgi:hypothetical protein
MINVKTKSQDQVHRIHRVVEPTTFRVLSRVGRGSSAVITLDVPQAGRICADGREIERVERFAQRRGG